MGAADGPILAVNAGSSSLKLAVLDGEEASLWARGFEYDGDPAALEAALEEALATAPDLAAAGHRVVHGADRYTAPTPIDAGVEAGIEALAELAPLHNPRSLEAIRALRALRPRLAAVACFDTAFHASLPAAAATYAIPAGWSAPFALRRYGFHGLSHAYAARRAASLLGAELESLRLVTAHLGAGASLAAVAGGRSLDTTMGLTPLEGLVMATRAGSVDPGLILWAERNLDRGAEEMERELDREAGLLALCGHSDMRRVIAGAEAGEERCRLAFDVYVHRLAGAVAAMACAAGGIDALVFTGGVGEHAAAVREAACAKLAFLGVNLESERNEGSGDRLLASREGAPAIVVEAREDIEIVRQTRRALGAA